MAADGDGEGWSMTGGVALGVGDTDVDSGLAETVGLAAVRASGVAPQLAMTNATVNAAVAAPSVDLMAVQRGRGRIRYQEQETRHSRVAGRS